ncbi:MAG: DNA-binding transcriptional LysR family regulator [Porticoccaceae bacterium]
MFSRTSPARILSDLEEAEDCAAADTQTVSGELRVAMPLSFGLTHLTSAISDFMRVNPAVNIDADLNDRAVDLINSRVDLAVRIGNLTDSSLMSRRPAPIHHVVAAAPAFWSEHGIRRTPDKLVGMPALSYSNLPTPDVWSWSNARGQSGQVTLSPRYRSNNGDAFVHAAIRGFGVIRLPTFMMNKAIEAGELTRTVLDKLGRCRALCPVSDTSFLPNRTRVFIDYLVTRFGE